MRVTFGRLFRAGALAAAFAASAAAMLAVILAACMSSCKASDEEDWAYDGPQSPCSTGTPYAERATVPDLGETNEANVRAPACIARCGAVKEGYASYGFAWAIDALPTGACTIEDEVCSAAAVRVLTCDDGTKTACSFTGYACRCERGTWRCYHGAVGASACSCDRHIDAGLDAGFDADADAAR